jgi:hypothetical protein
MAQAFPWILRLHTLGYLRDSPEFVPGFARWAFCRGLGSSEKFAGEYYLGSLMVEGLVPASVQGTMFALDGVVRNVFGEAEQDGSSKMIFPACLSPVLHPRSLDGNPSNAIYSGSFAGGTDISDGLISFQPSYSARLSASMCRAIGRNGRNFTQSFGLCFSYSTHPTRSVPTPGSRRLVRCPFAGFFVMARSQALTAQHTAPNI